LRRHFLPAPAYLVYWIEGSKEMGYKAGYLPQERLGLHGLALVGVSVKAATRRCHFRVGFEWFKGLRRHFRVAPPPVARPARLRRRETG
jgi:hypothetical protein